MAGRRIRKPVTRGVVKVPVVMQMAALECGAASLCMVMAYYGKWVPLEQVRKDCGVSRDGSKAANIVKAARNYGFTANGYRFEPDQLREMGTFPCIVHWEFNHFVVCDGFRGDKVYLNDPAKGSYAVSRERFDEGFTGVCLLMEPGEGFESGGKPKSIAGFARNRLRGAEAGIVFVALTTLVSSIAGILSSGFTRVFVDKLLTGKEPAWFVPFLVGLGILTFVQIVAAFLQAIYFLRLNGKMSVVGSGTFMWKVLHLPMEFFSQRLAGDIQDRKAANATVAGDVVEALAPLVLDSLMTVFYLVVMLRFSWLLTLVGVSSVLIQLTVSRIISARRVNITRVMMRDRGRLSAATVSGIEMIETIKASGAENGYFGRWSGYQASVNTQNVRYMKNDQYLGLIPVLVSGVLNDAVLVLGVWLTMRGHFTAGMVMAFQGFLGSFMAPAGNLITSGQRIQEMRTDMERIEDVMDYPDDDMLASTGGDYSGEEESGKLGGNLVLKNVTFGYSEFAPPVIEDLSLELKQGQHVALVGTTGCGKSTVAKLISGLYRPWSGEILFDGKPIDRIDRSVFTGSVAVVDQDIILFEDTIANNIRMWDTSIEDFEIIMAARDAQIHEDIMQRDGGYRYRITEGGKDFSGGQRQRLEIARVLAQDPTMVIMDEATSALDARTEYDVVRSIRDRGISCVVIAHRLSTIRDCDEIIVLDKGRVVERGTHDELMALDCAYRKLVTSE